MKKLLSLVLVLSLVLGSVAFAFATPEDVVGTDYEEAVTRLEALEILTGYADGTFKPDNTITRAEFAAVVVRALGLEAAAMKGETNFTDVPATHWASGYVNIASGLEIVNGYGNGMFGPEDPVTYEQAVTMAMRALGYGPKAEDKGGYPNGFLVVAAEEDVTDGVGGVVGAPASRGVVALLMDNALEVNLMERIGYGDEETYEVTDMTLLADKLGATEIEAVVDGVPFSDSDLDADEVALDGDVYELVAAGGANSYFGLEVTAWVNDDDEIFYWTVDSDVYYDEVVAMDDDEVELLVEDDEFDVASGADIYVNFEEVDADEVPDGAFGRFVMDDDEVVFASLFVFNEVDDAVVLDVDGDEVEYVADATTDTIEFDAFDDVYYFTAEMMEADAVDVEVDNAMFAWENDDDELFFMVATEVVEGELTAIKASDIKVDGSYYDTTDVSMFSTNDKDDFEVVDSQYDDYDKFMDEEVTMVLDLNGDVLLVYNDDDGLGDTIYGIATWIEEGRTSTLFVYTAEGEEMEYDFENNDDYCSSMPDNIQYDYAYAVKFKLNSDGEIADGEFEWICDCGDYDYIFKDTDTDRVTFSYFDDSYIDEDTIFMEAFDGDDLDPSLVDYEDVYENELIDLEVLLYGTEGKNIDFIVFVDAFEGEDDDVFYAVALEDSFQEGDDLKAELDVYAEGADEYVLEEVTTEGALFAFVLNSDDEASVESSDYNYDDDSRDYDDGFLEVDGDYIKVASDAIVYLLEDYDEGYGDIDSEVSNTKLDDYEVLEYILDDDGILVAAITYNVAVGEEPPVIVEELELSYTSEGALEVTGLDSVAGYAVVIDGLAEAVVAGDPDYVDFEDAIVDGVLYTADLVELSDIDTVLATVNFIGDVTPVIPLP